MEKSTVERKPSGYRLNPAITKALKIFAINNDLPVNVVLERAITEYLENQNKGYQAKEAAKIDSIPPLPAPPKPVQEKPTTPRTLPHKKYTEEVVSVLWSEYQEMKAASPKLTEAAFAKSKGIDKAKINKIFKPFKAAPTPETAPIKQPEHLSAPMVGTIGKES
ncbi:MAG: hypothetical protein HQK99_16790 [Nitrospirae bacterium]|nr:hypothetical protein [Nitrospirota bacterium]